MTNRTDEPTAPLPIPRRDARPIERLIQVMAALRHPDGGCPWDLEQTFETIAPYTIEEAYEVAEAIAQRDFVALKDELGDLLLQVVFHAQMAAEAGDFSYADVVHAVSEKMVKRHPHVFGDQGIRVKGSLLDPIHSVYRELTIGDIGSGEKYSSITSADIKEFLDIQTILVLLTIGFMERNP